MSTRWHFKNRKDGSEMVVSDMESAKNLAQLLSTKDGTGEWEITRMIEGVAMIQPTPPAFRTAPPVAPPAVKKGAERRAFKRHDARFRVLVIQDDRSFRSYSTNISLGGLRLEAAVPKNWNPSDCKVLISKPDQSENIELRCRFISDEQTGHRIKFVTTDGQGQRDLEGWLKVS